MRVSAFDDFVKPLRLVALAVEDGEDIDLPQRLVDLEINQVFANNHASYISRLQGANARQRNPFGELLQGGISIVQIVQYILGSLGGTLISPRYKRQSPSSAHALFRES